MATEDERVTRADDSTSPPKPGTSEVVTRVQAEEMVRKARSDALAEAGRLRKATDEAIKRAEAANARIARMQEDMEKAELEAARGDPDRETQFRTRQELRHRSAELEEAKAELDKTKGQVAELSSIKAEGEKQTLANELAAKYGVDPARLSRLAKFTDGTAEAIEALARDLPKLNPPAEVSPTMVVQPDSNRSKGGASLTPMQVRAQYIKGEINAVQYADNMKQLGTTP